MRLTVKQEKELKLLAGEYRGKRRTVLGNTVRGDATTDQKQTLIATAIAIAELVASALEHP